MFVIAQLFTGLALLTSLVFKILYFILVIRIILSWFQVDSYSGPALAIYQITDPILAPFRRLPLQIGPLDLSPILAFLVLNFLDNIIVGILHRLAIQIGA